MEKIKIARGKDEEVVRVVEDIKKAEVKILRKDEWQVEENLVLKEEKVYILKNKELRADIIWLHHDGLIERYGGRWKTIELVTRNYW